MKQTAESLQVNVSRQSTSQLPAEIIQSDSGLRWVRVPVEEVNGQQMVNTDLDKGQASTPPHPKRSTMGLLEGHIVVFVDGAAEDEISAQRENAVAGLQMCAGPGYERGVTAEGCVRPGRTVAKNNWDMRELK
uniref:Uncharacterized protein n=1 Tax=Knipowitschia caucasica TaxID=637954 RepID=A0AAV2JP41_KNICA